MCVCGLCVCVWGSVYCLQHCSVGCGHVVVYVGGVFECLWGAGVSGCVAVCVCVAVFVYGMCGCVTMNGWLDE